MARARSADAPRTRSKASAIDEIAHGINTFHNILTAIEDFSREGFPYRDGARAKAELQIRETVRRLFGERSPEFQAHRAHKLKISTPAETAQSVQLVKSLIAALENKKLELQGLAPAATTPETTPLEPPPSQPQMTLVPPVTPSAQVTMSQSSTGNTPPVTMSVAITTNLSRPEPAIRQAPPPDPAPSTETANPAQPPAQAIPASHLESARLRPVSAESPATPSAPVSPPTATMAATPITRDELLASAPIASVAIEPAASLPAQSETSPAPSELPKPVVSTEPTERVERQSVQPDAPAASAPTPAPACTPPPASTITSEKPVQSDPLDALRKVCLRFHAVARQLRLRKDYRTTLEVEDDYDLQDLLCALLKLEFDEVGSDEWTPPYAGGSTKTTLFLNRDQIAVVAKKTRSGLTTKELAEQISVDANHYAPRESCLHFFCFIYDPEGRIGSPKGLESDLTSVSDRYTIHVLVAPK